VVAHADYFETRDRLRKPFLNSLSMHVAVVGLLAGYAWWLNQGASFGGQDLGGGDGSIDVTPVKLIPVRTPQGPKNKVADDTESQVPTAHQKELKKEKVKEEADPKAVALLKKSSKKKEPQQTPRRYVDDTPDLPNQIRGNSQQLKSDMFGAPQSNGPVGIGQNTTLGFRFGAYQKLLQEKIAKHWNTGGINLQTAPVVTVTFEILRNGSMRNLRITQPSGNYALDNSIERAVTEASPFPELPAGFERDTAKVEMNFQYKR
jgi:TonB family protein